MSQPRRFTAPSLKDAYQKVRDEMGGDAIIISTRKVMRPGVSGGPVEALVEVRACVSDPSDMLSEVSTEMHDLVRDAAEEAATGLPLDPAVELAPAPLNRDAVRGVRPPATAPRPAEQLPAAAVHVPPPKVASVPPVTASALAPDPDPTVIAGLTHRIDHLRTLVESIAMERMGERSTHSPALRAAYERIEEQDMTRAAAAMVLARVESMLTQDNSREAGLRALNRALAALLPPTAMLTLGGPPRALVLVGPAGAGKTTLAMRLALELRRRGLRVMVAGTDVSRAGAPQQLEAIGVALGVSVRLGYVPADVAGLVDGGVADIVIVDTAGHMGTRRDRVAELGGILRSLPRRDVLLTLPATMRAADQREVVAAYGTHGLTGLVLTRCDETTCFGASASAAIESALGVAYTTHSDQITDAPRTGDTRTLAAAVATGRWAAEGATTLADRVLAHAS